MQPRIPNQPLPCCSQPIVPDPATNSHPLPNFPSRHRWAYSSSPDCDLSIPNTSPPPQPTSFLSPSQPRIGMTTRSQHGIFKPNPKYSSYALSVFFSPIPRNPIHVLYDPNWKQAMQDEFDALIENHT